MTDRWYQYLYNFARKRAYCFLPKQYINILLDNNISVVKRSSTRATGPPQLYGISATGTVVACSRNNPAVHLAVNLHKAVASGTIVRFQ